MGNLIDIQHVLRKQHVEALVQEIRDLYSLAGDVWRDFVGLVEKDLTEAIRQLPDFIERARDVNGPDRAFVEAVAGGPNHDWIVPLFNVIGVHYPMLDRDLRGLFLRHCLNYLDHLNYIYSQNHVQGLRGPLLVADIIVNRGLYYPGFELEVEFLKNHPTVRQIIKDKSTDMRTFWMCLAVVWNGEWTTLPVRRWYYRKNSDLVEQTLDYIAATASVYARRRARKEHRRLELVLSRRLNSFDPDLHDRIRAKVKEANWILFKE